MVTGNHKFKIIKDIVHGYIKITEFDEKLINSPHFQRLKDIRQLTAQSVYPSANHTRFEHSLGVMHLARKALEHLQPQLRQQGVSQQRFEVLYNNLSVAALLHDVGHAPYSHLGEQYYRKNEILFELEKATAKDFPSLDRTFFENGAKHELMSCLIILTKLKPLLKQNNLLNFELICRCILGKKYISRKKWRENIIIELLNSQTVDMDKLDYIVRDSFMTGIGFPPVDVNRLFMNIYIHPQSKTVTYKSNALSVIQNIIDTRDALYMWVINHHIAVYTDFLMEYYIRRLILNYERQQYVDRLNPEEFFSCSAIIDKLVSDSDLYSHLKLPLLDLSDPYTIENVSPYTRKLFPQLFQRQFLKPLWKTIYEYNIFLKEQIKDDIVINMLVEKLCDDKNYAYRRYFAKKIARRCNFGKGEVFIIPRSNKFYSFNREKPFTLHVSGSDKALENLLPQKKFGDLYNNVAFYIFAKPGKQNEVKSAFIQLAKQPLPDEDRVQADVKKLAWFKGEQHWG